MRKQSFQYKPSDVTSFKRKALAFASQYDYCSFFDNNGITNLPYGPFDQILAFGALKIITFPVGRDSFDKLKESHQQYQDWLIGFFSYELKNQIEKLESSHKDRMLFPEISFYIPENIIFFNRDKMIIESVIEPSKLIYAISNSKIKSPTETTVESLFTSTSRSKYLETINNLKNHIVEGDIYEINYCIEFFSDKIKADPLSLFIKLTSTSPTPFSVFHKFESNYLICASPERFLKKIGKKLISQPIKGTAKRGLSNYEDELIKRKLRTDEKELAENMMIVDLVRNDLSRCAKPGTVKPEELFGIYTFNQLHQMISTVTAELNDNCHFIDVIKKAFPMGSMTGAPKIRVMELIEKYENVKRGLYSGAMGYITPTGNFDFNVVIRSILYNESTTTLSFEVGSAITYDAKATTEYDECLLKAKAIMDILGNPQIIGK